MIKEINSTPPRFQNAMIKEFPNLDVGSKLPGGYSIPDDQDLIEELFNQIPPSSRNKVILDSNGDSIYDMGVILIGITRDIDQEQLVKDMNEKVKEFKLEKRAYRLIMNGGDYQEVDHLHFHLISDDDL